MTVGGGGGSPKTISRVIYTLGGGTVFNMYQCPIDTMAIIDPLMAVNAAGGTAGLSYSLQVRSANPVTGGDEIEGLVTTNQNGALQLFGGFLQVVNNVPAGGGLYNTVVNANLGRFEFTYTMQEDNITWTTYAKGLILYPGEKFYMLATTGVGSKFVYGLREYGISS